MLGKYDGCLLAERNLARDGTATQIDNFGLDYEAFRAINGDNNGL